VVQFAHKGDTISAPPPSPPPSALMRKSTAETAASSLLVTHQVGRSSKQRTHCHPIGEKLQQIHSLVSAVVLHLCVHSAQCCLASSCHAGGWLQSVPSVQLCFCAAAVAVADSNALVQVAAGFKTTSHVRCVLDDPGACCY